MSARILIIEDNEANRELASFLLSSAGHTVLTANDGGAGVRVALAERLDLVLCDLHLPVMDGFEVLGSLKHESTWHRVPVVALTASSMVGDREMTLAAGFEGYMSKPITPETFVQEVEAFLPVALRASARALSPDQ